MAKEGSVAPQERVNIVYKPATGNAKEEVELPLKLLMLGDYTLQEDETPLEERQTINIDKDNFNDVLEKSAPRLALKVENKLTSDDTKLAVELNFKNIDDFEPTKVAEQIPALKELLEIRGQLNQLLGKMEGNDKLEQLLTDVLGNTEKALSLAGELGVKPEGESKPETPTT